MSAVVSRARSGRRELEFDMLLCEEWVEEELEKIEEVGEGGREEGRLKESVNVELECDCDVGGEGGVEVAVENEGGVVEVG